MALYREKERDYIMIKKDITIYLSILIINLWLSECFTFSNHSNKCLSLLQICPLAKWLLPTCSFIKQDLVSFEFENFSTPYIIHVRLLSSLFFAPSYH